MRSNTCWRLLSCHHIPVGGYYHEITYLLEAIINQIPVGGYYHKSNTCWRLLSWNQIPVGGYYHGITYLLEVTIMGSHTCWRLLSWDHIPVGGYTGKVEDQIVIHQSIWFKIEACLFPVGSDSTGSSDCLTEVSVDGRSGCRLQPLQLAGCWNVKPLKMCDGKSFNRLN